ncbi:hypothetical protein ACMBCN_01250 [Candidatus Liberibacter asiaticus]|nr:hypothetical protein [Candidatus Liberibacter asiaticus]
MRLDDLVVGSTQWCEEFNTHIHERERERERERKESGFCRSLREYFYPCLRK